MSKNPDHESGHKRSSCFVISRSPVRVRPTAPSVPPHHTFSPQLGGLWPQQAVADDRTFDAANAALAAGEVTRSAWTLTLLMLLAGLRWSDVRWLRWEEIDLAQGCLRLLPRGDVRRENKSRDQRTIPLGADALELLRMAPRFCSWVAPNPVTRLPYTDIRKPLARICERAGVRITPHWLRHTYGTAAAEAGCTTEEIAAVLGHRSSATASRYVHLSGTFARGAAQRASGRVMGRAA